MAIQNNFKVKHGLEVATTATINSPQQSTSTDTGALVVAGGVGIGKNLFVGGTTFLAGDLYVDGTQFSINSTSITTGDKLLYLSTGSQTAAAANNSGIAIGPPNSTHASLLFDGVDSFKSSVSLIPDTTLAYNLGAVDKQWAAVYARNITSAHGLDIVNTDAGGFLNIITNGHVTQFYPSGDINPSGSIVGSSYGSNYLNVNKTGPLALGGNMYGVEITTGLNNAVDYTWTFNTDGKLTAPGRVVVQDFTTATSTATGALTVAGGVGIGGDLYVGGAVTAGNISTTGSIIFADGSSQYQRSTRMFTNADVVLGITTDDLIPGDFYYDDSTASIYVMIDTGQGYNQLLDLTVRTAV